MSAKPVSPVREANAAAETIAANLERVRVEIAVEKDRRGLAQTLAVSRKEAEARVNAFADQVQADTRDRLDILRFTAPTYRPPSTADAHALVLGAVADLIRRDLLDQIGEAYAEGDGITAGERERSIDAAEARILQLELAEEAIIRGAEASGLVVLRRANADPRAVLAADEALR